MDPLWIVAAFVFGAIVARLGLPPLVGYLAAGFVLNSFGVEGSQTLEDIANAGVTLLLFTIGLKLKIKSLVRPEVWAGATIHMLLTVAVLGAGIWFLGALAAPYFRLLTWQSILLVAFALSFSSTVLKRFETETRLKEDEPIHTAEAEVGVIGMGGVGTAAYDEMQRRYGNVVIAMDFSMDTVQQHRKMGRNVVYGDADDSDFWERVDLRASRIVLIMLALPDPRTSRFAVQQLQRLGFQGRIAASVRYEDEIAVLQEAGIDAAYSLFEEAGVGFADHVCSEFGYCRIDRKETKP